MAINFNRKSDHFCCAMALASQGRFADFIRGVHSSEYFWVGTDKRCCGAGATLVELEF